MNRENKDKERIRQKIVKIFAGSKNFQEDTEKALRANLLRKRFDALCYKWNGALRLTANQVCMT